jgi:hypothetical protein
MYLKELVMKAEADAKKLSASLQEVERHLVFHGFQGEDLPIVSMGTYGDIFLAYKGCEIDIMTSIEIMEEVGYITKDDFI